MARYEVTGAAELSAARAIYPHLSKVTVDPENGFAFVFIGRSNRGRTVSGAEYEALLVALAADDAAAPADVAKGEVSGPPGDPASVEVVDDAPAENKPKARSKKKES